MRVASGLLALSFLLSACATTDSATCDPGAPSPNGWAMGSRATCTAPARPAPRPPVVADRVDREPTRPEPDGPTTSIGSSSALVIPVAGFSPDRLRDSFDAPRSGGRVHQAIDLAAPTGTPLLAVTDGVVSRKHWNALGGNTLYLTSADGRYDFYYAHLDAYEEGIGVGSRVRRGDRLGTVGTTGNAQGAHLHFQVLDKRGGGRGVPVNPYDLLRGASPVRVAEAD